MREGRLGNYELLEPITSGGMGQVYLARRVGAESVCVLKQLLTDLEENETAAKRFHREAQVAAYLAHPNIARTIDAGFEDGTFCIAMELIVGKDLESMYFDLLQQGRLLPYEVSIPAILGALEGLHYAHSAKDPSGHPIHLVHRDLSPRNIMLSADGIAKIIDFGVAHGEVGDFQTAPGMFVGTLRFASPEQACSENVDHRSDLYSISVVLHELLTGQRIIPSGPDHMTILKFIVGEELPPISELNPQIPEEISRIVARGLRKEPAERWPDAGEYARALAAASGKLGQTKPKKIAKFLRSFFAEDLEKGKRWLSLGSEHWQAEVAAHAERAAALSSQTMTGYMLPDATLDSGDDSDVEPVDLTSVTQMVQMIQGSGDLPTRIIAKDAPSVSQATRIAMTREISGIGAAAIAGSREHSHSGLPSREHSHSGLPGREPSHSGLPGSREHSHSGIPANEPSHSGIPGTREVSGISQLSNPFGMFAGSNPSLPLPANPGNLPYGSIPGVATLTQEQLEALSHLTGRHVVRPSSKLPYVLTVIATAALVMGGMAYLEWRLDKTRAQANPPTPPTNAQRPSALPQPSPPEVIVAQPAEDDVINDDAPDDFPDPELAAPKTKRRVRPPADKAAAKAKAPTPVAKANPKAGLEKTYKRIRRQIDKLDELPRAERSQAAVQIQESLMGMVAMAELPRNEVSAVRSDLGRLRANPTSKAYMRVLDNTWRLIESR